LKDEENFFKYTVDVFQHVYDKTTKQKNWQLWRNFDLFVVDLHNEIVEKCKERLPESLTYQRILDTIRTMWLVTFEICSGAYRSAMRNLRFILESLIQAYYLDKEFPYEFATEKIDRIDVDKLYGRHLILEKARMPPGIYTVYSDLSKYMHSSKAELEHMDEILMEEGMTPTIFVFDKSVFQGCHRVTLDAIEAITYVILNAFPEVKGSLKDLARKRDLEEAFTKSSQQLCLSLL